MHNTDICYQCKKGIYDRDNKVWEAFDVLNDYNKIRFCSAECLNDWKTGKKSGLFISIILGIILAVYFCISAGVTGLYAAFVPYMIRKLFNKGLGDGGFLSFMVVLFGSITIIYPVYKMSQELTEYKRIETVLANAGIGNKTTNSTYRHNNTSYSPKTTNTTNKPNNTSYANKTVNSVRNTNSTKPNSTKSVEDVRRVCLHCQAECRVPGNLGSIVITCPNCGNKFGSNT